MRYILNSAVITTPGVYTYSLINADEAKKWIEQGEWASTLGYIETAIALSTLLGVQIPYQRKLVSMQSGDEALVFRLTCRLDNPALKGNMTVEFILKNCEIGMLVKK